MAGWDVKKLMGQIDLAYAHLEEQGIEPFLELARTDPERAIEEFSETLEKTLSRLGGGIFQGIGCGGPFEGATIPFLNGIGAIYPKLRRPVREKALREALKFLDGLNYFVSQNNVEGIHEPWLVGDIILNRGLYWPGFNQYVKMLKGKTNWEDIEKDVIKTKGNNDFLDVKSEFWFAYTLGREKYGPKAIRDRFTELLPETIDRTKDAIAALTAYDVLSNHKTSVNNRLKKYAPEWREDIIDKLRKRDFILLEYR